MRPRENPGTPGAGFPGDPQLEGIPGLSELHENFHGRPQYGEHPSKIRSGTCVQSQKIWDGLLEGLDVLKRMMEDPKSEELVDSATIVTLLDHLAIDKIGEDPPGSRDGQPASGESAPQTSTQAGRVEVDSQMRQSFDSELAAFESEIEQARIRKQEIDRLRETLKPLSEWLGEGNSSAGISDSAREMLSGSARLLGEMSEHLRFFQCETGLSIVIEVIRWIGSLLEGGESVSDSGKPLFGEALVALFADLDSGSPGNGAGLKPILEALSLPPKREVQGPVLPPQQEPDPGISPKAQSRPLSSSSTAGGSSHDSSSGEKTMASGQTSSRRIVETVRINVDLLDSLMNLAGELVLVRNQQLFCAERGDPVPFSSVQRLHVLTRNLQETIMLTRMQPVGNVLGKFPRLVRDLGKNLKKQIELVVIGSEVELDKSVLENLADPLTHLVRNACDHGLELPEERLRKGKAPVGTLTIRAFHEGGQINITVNDDGRGLDVFRI